MRGKTERDGQEGHYAANPEAQALFEELERMGVMWRTGESVYSDADGRRYPVYTEGPPEWFLRAAAQEVLGRLEREGRLEKTGEYELGPEGQLYPVYRARPQGPVD